MPVAYYLPVCLTNLAEDVTINNWKSIRHEIWNSFFVSLKD
jgi:hypothetical protein